LKIEKRFYSDVVKANKEINSFLVIEPLNNIESVYQKFLELYDNKSVVRYHVETFDNIEPIRLYLEKYPDFYKENKTHKSLVYVTNIVKYFKPFQICVLYFCMLI
jgi:hypothetical protein